ncbi:3-oxoacyl-ACP reductase FabG [Parabacteroides goldsteinii]|nr:3-oxoacyl-ACP reductase FabG [Parabacteroides goldsteinii]UBD75782.1 3-oxoacyl-ACP reductase FabG [Parabacteroides goldsteinii]
MGMMENKIVFITGGDKGIGKAIVCRFAELYKTVIFTYNKNVEGAKEVGEAFSNVFFYQCDLANAGQCENLAKDIIRTYGKVDILINNAGYDNDSTFLKMEKDQWDTVIDINLRSIYYFTQSFSRIMSECKWGRIINLTSIAGFTGAFGKSNYAAAKAGVVGFTKSLAMELGKKGVTVNAIAPGAIKTEMLMRIPEKYREGIIGNIPAGRFGEPEEVADLAEFLVSDKAKYINGQTIHINGGSYL